ncbi:hypothetical protein BRC97_05420 [Halobacteriales archaeon QS_6_71_20]|nr:MAG: hypothetical protein BRC97_05420 [Halobacteriales archaeon QS_6_71_20]
MGELTRRVVESDRIKPLAEAALLGLSSRLPLGTNVFSKDWDMLVLLDTCRVDALRSLRGEFDFLDDVGSTWSVGSSTREWAANTFTPEFADEIGRTAVVTSNPRVPWVLDGRGGLEGEFAGRFTDWTTVGRESVGLLDALPEYAPKEPYGGLVTPDVVTDRAIRVGRARSFDRLIVHYLPPHNPYRSRALRTGGEIRSHEYRPFDHLRDGGDRATVRSAYLDELRWALEHVETLLENVDAERTVISADHGELFGHLGLYSHPTGVPHPSLRRVPWVRTTATDGGSYDPHFDRAPDGAVSADTAEQLEHLGYR